MTFARIPALATHLQQTRRASSISCGISGFDYTVMFGGVLLMSKRIWLGSVSTCVLVVLLTTLAVAQSLTSGDLTGLVTDQTGAVIANATITLTNKNTGSAQTHTSSQQGSYRFSLLSPGSYTLSVSAPNFQSVDQSANVSLG